MTNIPVLTLWNRFTQVGERVANRYLKQVFSIDERAIAVFRMLLGSVVITDVLIRLGYLNFFYTDNGVYPVKIMLQYNDGVFGSIAAVMSNSIGAVLVFSLCIITAGMVVIGYKSRVMMFTTLLLVLVIHHRNIFTLNSGDLLLRCLLLWGVFLPLGKKWSVDSVLRNKSNTGETSEMVFSAGTVAVLTQMLLVYLVNVSHKLRGEEWVNGQAAERALDAGHMVTSIGDFMVDFEVLMTIGTYWWVGLLIASPLLLVPDWRVRTVMASSFIAAHTGMALTLKIGVFPFTAIAALLLFYPNNIWGKIDALTKNLQRVMKNTLEDKMKIGVGIVQSKMLLSHDNQRVKTVFNTVIPVLLLCIAVSGAVTSAGVLDESETINNLDEITLQSNEQNWAVYAPTPISYEMWFVHELTLVSGKEVNVYHDGRTIDKRPDNIKITKQVRKYRQELLDTDDESLKQAYGAYYCSNEHDIPESQVEQVKVKLTQTIYGDNPETSRGTLITTRC